MKQRYLATYCTGSASARTAAMAPSMLQLTPCKPIDCTTMVPVSVGQHCASRPGLRCPADSLLIRAGRVPCPVHALLPRTHILMLAHRFSVPSHTAPRTTPSLPLPSPPPPFPTVLRSRSHPRVGGERRRLPSGPTPGGSGEGAGLCGGTPPSAPPNTALGSASSGACHCRLSAALQPLAVLQPGLEMPLTVLALHSVPSPLLPHLPPPSPFRAPAPTSPCLTC